MNCFAGSGQISWDTTGSNQLSFASDITFRFYNRVSTYTISAIPGGMVIGDNQVAYVQIPDADTSSTLTLSVADFGAGVLDRYGKNVFPLFWNIGGTLYLRFAPYSLSSGETIILGDQLSQQFIAWAGSGSSVPNPSNHAYSSTSGAGLLQSDSLNTAIGKLDAAISSRAKASTVSIPGAVSTLTVIFGSARADASYAIVTAMSNTTDSLPQFQPVVVTSKSTTGFVATWNAPTDSGNYSLEYVTYE